MKYYQVRWGFDQSQYISIDETELSKALRAQVNGTAVIFKSGKSLSGSNIKIIEPDFHKHLGLYPTYTLQADDLAQIPSKIRQEHEELMTLTAQELPNQIVGRRATDHLEAPPVKRVESGSIGEFLERGNHRAEM